MSEERLLELVSAVAAYVAMCVSVDDAAVDGFDVDAWLKAVSPFLPREHPVNVILREPSA